MAIFPTLQDASVKIRQISCGFREMNPSLKVLEIGHWKASEQEEARRNGCIL